MLNSNFVILGALISAAGSISYLIDTFKGKVKPNRVSFLLWSISPFIAFAAQIKQGVGIEALMTFSFGFFPLLIFLTSFTNKNAEWKLTKFDWGCGALSIIGLILWLITKDAYLAIGFSIAADALAALPTLAKSYTNPETETSWPWILGSIGVAITLFTLSKITFLNAGFIIYAMLINIVIFSLIQFKLGEKLGKIKT